MVAVQSAGPTLFELTGAQVFVKYEGLNPTGSFKDRGMTTAISFAKGRGAKAVICASTGNTSASLSSYAAQAGIPGLVFVPAGKVAVGKLARIDLLAQVSREDADESDLQAHIMEYMVVHETGVHVLAAPRDPSEADRITPPIGREK